MKQANKFMVVPYEEPTQIKSILKTPDSKISDIVNNQNLDKNDKVKLINQLLVKKQNNWPVSDEISNNMGDETIEQTFNDGYQDDNQIIFEKSYNNNSVSQKNSTSSIKRKPKKTSIPKKEKLNATLLNNYINDLNKTLNNAQFFLPPTASTRNQVKKIKNPISFSKEAVQKSIADFVAKQAPTNEITQSKPKKPKYKSNLPYTLPQRQEEIDNQIESQKLKKLKKSDTPINLIEVDQNGEGFWSRYKK